jgi:hypothetical protein
MMQSRHGMKNLLKENMKTCANCGKESQSTIWEKGEACLFGMIYCCSSECAAEWVEKHKSDIVHFDRETDLEVTEE